MSTHCQVVTTVGSRSAADALAEGAVRARLAACAQVTGPVASVYWWQGAIETAEEWQVVFKTTTVRYPDLAAHILSTHDYTTPEVLCLPVIDGDAGYLAWITEQTQP